MFDLISHKFGKVKKEDMHTWHTPPDGYQMEQTWGPEPFGNRDAPHYSIVKWKHSTDQTVNKYHTVQIGQSGRLPERLNSSNVEFVFTVGPGERENRHGDCLDAIRNLYQPRQGISNIERLAPNRLATIEVNQSVRNQSDAELRIIMDAARDDAFNRGAGPSLTGTTVSVSDVSGLTTPVRQAVRTESHRPRASNDTERGVEALLATLSTDQSDVSSPQTYPRRPVHSNSANTR
jgi:hypothetical protein